MIEQKGKDGDATTYSFKLDLMETVRQFETWINDKPFYCNVLDYYISESGISREAFFVFLREKIRTDSDITGVSGTLRIDSNGTLCGLDASVLFTDGRTKNLVITVQDINKTEVNENDIIAAKNGY